MTEIVELLGRPGPAPGRPKVPGSGRKPGNRNTISKELREVAQKYTARALRQLVRLFTVSSWPFSGGLH